ncbi:MAG: hypothetical protein IJP23_07355 [Oscillospiraceae bacterium]|nr:hypothetical protein [Oscillospiraceae bacterium]
MLKISLGRRKIRHDGRNLEIKYDIVAERMPGERETSYGMLITTEIDNTSEEALFRDISTNYNECRDILMYLKRNAVTAVSAAYVVSDLMLQINSEFDLDA